MCLNPSSGDPLHTAYMLKAIKSGPFYLELQVVDTTDSTLNFHICIGILIGKPQKPMHQKPSRPRYTCQRLLKRVHLTWSYHVGICICQPKHQSITNHSQVPLCRHGNFGGGEWRGLGVQRKHTHINQTDRQICKIKNTFLCF